MSVSDSNLLNSQSTQASESFASDSLVFGMVFAVILTFVQRLVGFVRNILFCRMMSDEQLGQWSLIYSFVLLIAPLAVLGLPGCFGRFVEHFQRRGQLATFLKRISWICSFTLGVALIFLFAFPAKLSWILFRQTDQIGIVYAFGFTLLFITILNYLTSLLESLRQVRFVTILRFISGVLFAIVSLALLNLSSDGTVAVTIGFGIGAMVACLPAVWFLWKRRTAISNHGEHLTQQSMWRRIAPYALWMWLCNFVHNAFEVSDRYMLVHWSPVDPEMAQSFVGQYHSGRVIPLVLVGIASVLCGLLMPYMTEHWEKGDKDKAVRQLNWSVKLVGLVFTFAGTAVLVFAPWLFGVVLQGRYDDGLAVLPLTIIYCTWFSLLIIAQDYLWVAEKGAQALLASAFGLLANLVLNALLIPEFGLWGAVIATSLANILTLICIFMANWRNGAVPDRGCWLISISPLILLLPTYFALGALAILIASCHWTQWILDDEDKHHANELGQRFLDKIKR